MLNLKTFIARIQQRLAADGWSEADADRAIVVLVDELYQLYQLAADYVPRALWATAGLPDAAKLRTQILDAIRREPRARAKNFLGDLAVLGDLAAEDEPAPPTRSSRPRSRKR